ncbi:hypothetical protein Tco_0783372 [Tanacetum coccineum]
MENEHELSYETLTRVYLGSYEHYKSVGAEVESLEPGLRFLNFFNDPRIIREQRIAAYKGYRGGGLDMVFKSLSTGASFTQRTVSSISVGGSINLEGFLSSILLSVVIIINGVIVVVILDSYCCDDCSLYLSFSLCDIGFLTDIMLYYLIINHWEYVDGSSKVLRLRYSRAFVVE